MPGAVFTHHISPFLTYRSLLILRAVSQHLSALASHKTSWSHTTFTPRSLHQLLYLSSSTSSSFPSLHFARLDLTHCPQLNDQHLDLVLRCFPHLTAIRLNHLHRLSSHALSLLALHLSASPAGSSQLARIELQSALYGFGVEELVSCHPLLTEMDLSACLQLRGVSLRQLVGASHLRSLSLAHCTQLRDSAFSFLKSAVVQQTGANRQSLPLHALTHLDVSHCIRLTNRVCQYFSYLPSLTSLSLSSCQRVSALGLHHLAASSSLCRLTLASLQLAALLKLSDSVVYVLSALPALTAVDISDTSLTSAAVLQLLRETGARLTRLVVDGCDKVNVDTVPALLTAPALQHLSLAYNYHVTSDALTQAGSQPPTHQPRLASLSLQYTSLTHPLFLTQPAFASLTALDLTGNSVAVPVVAHSFVVCLPVLRCLCLSSCGLSAGLLAFFGHHAPRLYHLDLSHCSSLTNSLLTSLISFFPALSSLVLDNTHVNDTSLLILSTFPLLSRLSLHECKQLTAGGLKILQHSADGSGDGASYRRMRQFSNFFSSFFSSSSSSSSYSSSSPSSSSGSTSPSQGAFASLPSLSDFSLPSLPSSLSFDLPSSFSLPSSISSHLPHVHLPHLPTHMLPNLPSLSSLPSMPSMSMPSMPSMSMPTMASMASLPTHLSIPRPSVTLHSLQSRFRSHMNGSNLTFPGSFSSFSSPFSSAFTALRDEEASPFAPSVNEEEQENEVEGERGDAGLRADGAASRGVRMDVDGRRAARGGEEDEGEEDDDDADEDRERGGEDEVIAPPSPPAGSVSSTSSLSHTDGEEDDDDDDDDMPASPSSLSTASSSSYPPSSSLSVAAATLPLVPFASLTWLHICCIAGANGKEDKLAANIRRAHPHCVVEGESERANREDGEKEARERRERRQRDGPRNDDDEDGSDDEQADEEEEEEEADEAADEKEEDEWDAMLAMDDGTAAEEKKLERLEARKRERHDSLADSDSSGSGLGMAHSSSFSRSAESLDDNGFDEDEHSTNESSSLL